MKRMRPMGIGILTALAASMALAASASAGEYNLKMRPEVGRCIKVARGGEFRGPRCLRSEPGAGRYSWLSGPGPKPKFTATITGPINLKLAGAPEASTFCASAELKGEYTGPKNMKVTSFVFPPNSCSSTEGECQNKAGSTNGEITGEALVGELGYITHPKKEKIGWDLKPASGSNLASYECGGANKTTGKSTGGGITRELQGSVIGKIGQINRRMTSEFAVTFELDKHGAQFPEHFEGGVTDTLTTLLGEKFPAMGKTPHATTMVGQELIKNEEPLEVLGRCVGVSC